PVYALPNGRSAENDFLDDLWLDPADTRVPYSAPLTQLVRESGLGWRSFFGLSDAFLRGYERYRAPVLRRLALGICRRWILERQEPEGDWAGILPRCSMDFWR